MIVKTHGEQLSLELLSTSEMVPIKQIFNCVVYYPDSFLFNQRHTECSVILICVSVCRMSDGGGEVDQRFQPGSEVHHPHGGTEIQEQVQDGGGELAVQLLQEHHAAGCVSIKSSLV